jgi:hypothetical protein
VEYVLLIETANIADVALIKSILDAEGILYFAHGEQFNLVRPMLEPVRFMVPEDQLDRARDVLSGISFTYSPLSTHGGEEDPPPRPVDDAMS